MVEIAVLAALALMLWLVAKFGGDGLSSADRHHFLAELKQVQEWFGENKTKRRIFRHNKNITYQEFLLLIEVSRRMKTGEYVNMFQIFQPQSGGLDDEKLTRTIYDHRSGSLYKRRVSRAFDVAVSAQNKGLFEFIARSVRGGHVIHGLRLTDLGSELVAEMIIERRNETR